MFRLAFGGCFAVSPDRRPRFPGPCRDARGGGGDHSAIRAGAVLLRQRHEGEGDDEAPEQGGRREGSGTDHDEEERKGRRRPEIFHPFPAARPSSWSRGSRPTTSGPASSAPTSATRTSRGGRPRRTTTRSSGRRNTKGRSCSSSKASRRTGKAPISATRYPGSTKGILSSGRKSTTTSAAPFSRSSPPTRSNPSRGSPPRSSAR